MQLPSVRLDLALESLELSTAKSRELEFLPPLSLMLLQACPLLITGHNKSRKENYDLYDNLIITDDVTSTTYPDMADDN